jgi:putative transposase
VEAEITGHGIRPAAPQTRKEGLRVVGGYVEYYNSVRLPSAIGYVTPNDFLAGRQEAIWAARNENLTRARELPQRRATKAVA